jgi:hypothetical protein
MRQVLALQCFATIYIFTYIFYIVRKTVKETYKKIHFELNRRAENATDAHMY